MGRPKLPNKLSTRERAFQYRHKEPVKFMVWKAKKNAKKSGLSFDLTSNCLPLPEVCPILGIPLSIGAGDRHDNSPSLDRFDSSKGYTIDNVNIISWRANHLKNNGTAEEFEKIASWMKEQESNRASLASQL